LLIRIIDTVNGSGVVELRHLHYFLKIAETSSFTQAAAALQVTQPTLSHQIKQLEWSSA